MTIQYHHSTGDEVLSHLATNQGTGGDLVRAFPGSEYKENLSWLDEWFQDRIEKHFSGPPCKLDAVLSFDPPPTQVEAVPLAPPVKLKSLQAHHFRGFRQMSGPIDMSEDFIVIEGRNSSGKTSLAEALEWLFTGSLSRRVNNAGGNPRELQQCITNQFRPQDAETWVDASFVLESGDGDTKEFNLRRVLKEDYGTTINATCESVLFLDDKELTQTEEKHELERLIAGVAPLLMQHTLREFVHGEPKRRREYFERLLRLDELTELIRLALVTDERAMDFSGPAGGRHLRLWNDLGSMLRNDTSKKVHNQLIQSKNEELPGKIATVLASISRVEFPSVLDGLADNENVLPSLKNEQTKVRQSSFPILAQLRPKRQVSEDTEDPNITHTIDLLVQKTREVWKLYEIALQGMKAIGDNNLAVSRAYKVLKDAGLIKLEKGSQSCPICAYSEIDTLSAARVTTIQSWEPISESVVSSRQELAKAMTSLVDVVRGLLHYYTELLPDAPPASDWDLALTEASDTIRKVAKALKAVIGNRAELEKHVSKGRVLVSNSIVPPTTTERCEEFIENCTNITKGLANLPAAAKKYRDCFMAVEVAVGSEASTDPNYRLREYLINCIENAGALSMDVQWEKAKRLAQKDLKKVRQSLMTYRQAFLESRSGLFNAGIESVWENLRKDRYSSFSQLHIPKPRGKGFPIEIELKALLDDSNDQIEVDALRVFSESQVNALGIAAFVTRGKLLGHRMLIFDDPVQSMDEEHFKTFARDLLPQVVDQGFQVILLTHNYTFARDVSNYHWDRSDYVTMSIRHSRKKGSVVNEGNRRVAERLTVAERKLDQGDLDEAWRYTRLAIERLYLVAYLKYGPASFEPESWQRQTAEHMWSNGANKVISTRMPDAESRLKDILDMTAAGAHDAPARGETDVRDGIAYLRGALESLGIGG